MNIFLTSNDVRKCAAALDDLRLNKMILETAQMLSTNWPYVAKYFNSPDEFDGIYKATHLNHPCTVWARENPLNFRWTLSLLKALHNEKYDRTYVSHKSYSKIYVPIATMINDAGFTVNVPRLATADFTFNCSNTTKDELVNIWGLIDANVFQAYRICLIKKWNTDRTLGREPTWKHAKVPNWLYYSYPMSYIKNEHERNGSFNYSGIDEA